MGEAVGAQSRHLGFSVQLAGGMNLIREPRGGRNFEYVGEDALHTGLLTGASVAGIQSQGVVSTLKHFAINPEETGRVMISSDISEKALRESDLLSFQLAVEHGQPRSIMTGYNMLNKIYTSENHFLLTSVLKGDWQFKGFVMSDWGATHSTDHAAWAGLDRQSGWDLDTAHFFGEPLKSAVIGDRVSEARLDDMVTRILAALHSVGALEGRRLPGSLPTAAPSGGRAEGRRAVHRAAEKRWCPAAKPAARTYRRARQARRPRSTLGWWQLSGDTIRPR